MACCQISVWPNSWQLHLSKGLAPFPPISNLRSRRFVFVYRRVRRSEFTLRCSESDASNNQGKKASPLGSEWPSPDVHNLKENKLSVSEYLKAGAGLFLAIGLAFWSHNLYSRRGDRDRLFVSLSPEQDIILYANGPGVDCVKVSLPSIQDQSQEDELLETSASYVLANCTSTSEPASVDNFALGPDSEPNSTVMTESFDAQVSLIASCSENEFIPQVADKDMANALPNSGTGFSPKSYNVDGGIVSRTGLLAFNIECQNGETDEETGHFAETNSKIVLHVNPGKVVVPGLVDHMQVQTLAALQALKVIEAGVEPSGICTRREYARWLIAASDILARNPVSKVFPAMYIENLTELAFDDVTPEDPDFPFIQGLAEAGLIASKLSRHHGLCSLENAEQDGYNFSPDSPLSRQNLVCWKIALERRQLFNVDRKTLMDKSGFIDIDKINHDAWPALLADLLSGEQSIVNVAFGYTRLFQPNKPVTKAQAAAALATGESTELVMEELARIEADSLAEAAVAAHASLEAQVHKDLNAAFEKELDLEKDKFNSAERLAQEARLKLERLRAEWEEEKCSLSRDRAAIHSESELLLKLSHEMEGHAQALVTKKLERSFEQYQLDRLRKEAEDEKQCLVQIRSEVEVEKKSLSIVRSWAEDEAKKVTAYAKVLEAARKRWESQGIQVQVDKELDENNIPGLPWKYGTEVGKNSEKSPFLKVVASGTRGKFLVLTGKIKQAMGLILTNKQQKEAATGKSTQ